MVGISSVKNNSYKLAPFAVGINHKGASSGELSKQNINLTLNVNIMHKI